MGPHSSPELRCEHDYVDNVVTEYWCPECEDYNLPMQIDDKDRWQCPECNNKHRFP